MLSQTKENIQDLVNKIQVLDFMLNSVNLSHKDHSARVEAVFKRASNHKLKMMEEILRLSGVAELTPDNLQLIADKSGQEVTITEA